MSEALSGFPVAAHPKGGFEVAHRRGATEGPLSGRQGFGGGGRGAIRGRTGGVVTHQRQGRRQGHGRLLAIGRVRHLMTQSLSIRTVRAQEGCV